MIGYMLSKDGRFAEARPFLRRGAKMARQLADANPTSAAYRVDLALGLKSLALGDRLSGDLARARRYALEALATIRSLPTAQRDRYESGKDRDQLLLGPQRPCRGRGADGRGVASRPAKRDRLRGGGASPS